MDLYKFNNALQNFIIELNELYPSIDISMLQPLLVMTLAFTLIGLIIAILRIKAEILIRRNHL